MSRNLFWNAAQGAPHWAPAGGQPRPAFVVHAAPWPRAPAHCTSSAPHPRSWGWTAFWRLRPTGCSSTTATGTRALRQSRRESVPSAAGPALSTHSCLPAWQATVVCLAAAVPGVVKLALSCLLRCYLQGNGVPAVRVGANGAAAAQRGSPRRPAGAGAGRRLGPCSGSRSGALVIRAGSS